MKSVLKIINDFNVKTILEVGLGIGAICDTVLKYSKASNKSYKYVGTEANEFCLNALKDNVEFYNELEINKDVDSVESSQFDFIIIDGADDTIKSIKHLCKPRTVIYIEGFRGSQVNIIKEVFPSAKHSEIISLYKNPEYGPFPSNRWVGGGQLIFIKPTGKQNIYWAKEKVKTFIKRKLRKFYN